MAQQVKYFLPRLSFSFISLVRRYSHSHPKTPAALRMPTQIYRRGLINNAPTKLKHNINTQLQQSKPRLAFRKLPTASFTTQKYNKNFDFITQTVWSTKTAQHANILKHRPVIDIEACKIIN